jgi:ABC-2 type transport system ATP-binding protein
MIEAENLTKFYGRKAVVRGISFNVERGEIVGLLGPNGAGKTTTMRMLTGYLTANSGKAIVAGYNVSENPLEVRKRLGYLPETVPLYTDMTVRAYLDFTAKLRGVPGKERRRRVEEVMGKCRVSDVAGKVIGKLSRGYKQRVGLAQAIVHNPDVIILDEPTVGLDPRQIIEIRQVIRELAGAHSLILSTHILQEVSTLCDRVIIINQGRVLIDDSLANLERQGQESERLQVEVRGPADKVLELLRNQPGIEDVVKVKKSGDDETAVSETSRFVVDGAPGSDHRESLANLILSNGFGLLELKTAVPTLEEIFVRVITEDPQIVDEDEYANAELDDELDSEAEDEELDEEDELDEEEATSVAKTAPTFLQNNDDELDEPEADKKKKK